MGKFQKYQVAGHVFGIEFPDEYDMQAYLQPYQPFIYEGEDECLFSLKVSITGKLSDLNAGKVKDCMNEEAPYFWILEGKQWNFGFSYTKKHPDCIVIPDEGFRKSTVYVPASHADLLMEFAVSNAMMLLYTFNTTMKNTLLIHSSVTVKDGVAYAFLGKSGTGKSTHSRLWLENISGTYLLNDDNPAIRIVDGKVLIYGTPWSGKTPCYNNDVKHLGGIVRLSQAPYNKIERLSPLHAYAALMPSCSCMRWERAQTDALNKCVEEVVMKVPCYGLECLPDADAARVCCSAVNALL